MAKKLKALADGAGERQLASTVRDSAQQIWLAGLGAFSKTQEEGAKVFEALVKEGKHLEARTRKLAEAKVSEMTSKWSKQTGKATARATATWDKLEQVFEDRVERALEPAGRADEPRHPVARQAGRDADRERPEAHRRTQAPRRRQEALNGPRFLRDDDGPRCRPTRGT